MEIGQLQAFERIARDGSFTRAAEALGLTQPAVSTRITSLEAELGGPLFERRGRYLHLTPLGERVLVYAQRILSAHEECRQAARDYLTGRAGTVRIAAPTPFVLSFLVDVLLDFHRQAPTVNFFIRERDKTTIYELLRSNTLTLGLVNAPIFDQQFTQIARFQDPIRPVVGTRHPLAREAGPLTVDAIYAHTIFRVSMFPQMTAFMDELVEHGRGGSGGAVLAVPMAMALQLAVMNQGVTFLPESYVRDHVRHGELIYLAIRDLPALYSQPVLIAHRSRSLDEIHQRFIAHFIARWAHLQVS